MSSESYLEAVQDEIEELEAENVLLATAVEELTERSCAAEDSITRVAGDTQNRVMSQYNQMLMSVLGVEHMPAGSSHSETQRILMQKVEVLSRSASQFKPHYEDVWAGGPRDHQYVKIALPNAKRAARRAPYFANPNGPAPWIDQKYVDDAMYYQCTVPEAVNEIKGMLDAIDYLAEMVVYFRSQCGGRRGADDEQQNTLLAEVAGKFGLKILPHNRRT